MVEEEFIRLFQDDNVELASLEQKKLDKDSVSNATLNRIRQKDLAMMVQQLTWDEKYEWLNYQKQKANKLYYEEKYDRAIQIYTEMSVGLDLQQENQSLNQIMQGEFQMAIINNLALSYKKKKDYMKALKFFDMAIAITPSPQGYLKRAYCHWEMEDYAKCRTDIKQFIKSPKTELIPEANRLITLLQDSEKRQIKSCKKMFQQDDDDQQVQQTQQSEQPKQGLVKVIYYKVKSILSAIFGCKRIFVDDTDSEEEEESDPQKFLQQEF